MANAGIGFATGLLGGLTKNIAQNEQDQRLRSLLQGDMLGLGAEAGVEPGAGATQDLGGGESGGLRGITSAFGLTRTAGPSIETLIQLRSQLQARAKAEEKEKADYDKVLELLKNGKTFSSQEEAVTLAGIRKPMRKMILQGQFRQANEAKAFRDKFGQRIMEGAPESELAAGFLQLGKEEEAVKLLQKKESRLDLAYNKPNLETASPEYSQTNLSIVLRTFSLCRSRATRILFFQISYCSFRSLSSRDIFFIPIF